MNQRILSAVLCACMVIVTGQPAAGEPAVKSIDAGQRATFDGLLVPPLRMHELSEAEVDVDALTIQLTMKTEVCDSIQKIYAANLEAATAAPPWFDSPSLNRWLGFGLGVVVMSAAGWGAMQLSR